MLPYYLIPSRRNLIYWIKLILVSSIIPFIMVYIDYLRGGGMHGRVQGAFTHPNILAFYSVFIVTVCIIILKQSKKYNFSPKARTAVKILIINALIILVLTETRSAWVALWGFLFLYGLIRNRRVLLLAILLPVLALAIPKVQERVVDLTHGNVAGGYRKLNSFAWRLEMWKTALPEAMKRPIGGWGLASFQPYSAKYFTNKQVAGLGAHNAFLEQFFECGIIGLIAFISLFAYYIKHFYKLALLSTGKERDKYLILCVYVVSYLVICFSDNLTYYLVFNWYFWFFLGLMAREAQLEKVSELK